MTKLIGRTLVALAALLLAPMAALAQSTPENTLPRGIYGPNGRDQLQTAPAALITKDSVSGNWCIVGSTATCVLPGTGGGGGGGGTTPFTPTGAATLSVSSTSSRVALPSGVTVLLVNNGAADLAFKLGNSTVTAATTDYALPAGRAIVLAAGANTHIAGITASGSTTLQVTAGSGTPVISGGGGGGGGGSTSVTATAAAPSYAEGSSTNPLSVTLAGDLRTSAKQSGTWNIGSITTLPALPTGSNTIGAVTQAGTWNIGSVTTLPALPAGANTIGTVNLGTLNGAATAANQTAVQGTFGAVTAGRAVIYDSTGAAVDWSAAVDVNCLSGCGGGGGSSGGTATAAAPSYTEGATGQALSLNLTGDLRTIAKQSGTWSVDLGSLNGAATAAKQPALGTAGTPSSDVLTVQGHGSMTPFLVAQATAANLNATVVGGGTVSAGTAQAGSLLGGCVYNTTVPGPLNNQQMALQCNGSGFLRTQMGGQAETGSDGRANINGLVLPFWANANANTGLLASASHLYNGTSWDRPRGTTVGAAVQPYGIRASRWSYAAATGGILNTTTAVTIAPAVASFRNCLVTLDLTAEALGTATEFAVRDGAGGTVIYRTKIGTAGLVNGRTVTFQSPVCGSVNTLMEVVTLTASGTGAVYANATGNLEP